MLGPAASSFLVLMMKASTTKPRQNAMNPITNIMKLMSPMHEFPISIPEMTKSRYKHRMVLVVNSFDFFLNYIFFALLLLYMI